MQTVYEALTGATPPKGARSTGQPVHRYSKTARGKEGRFWQPFNPKHTAQIMQAAERYDRIGRMACRSHRNGRKNGHIGHIGLEVLRELLRLIDYKTGRLDPAIRTIATRIGRSVAAVVEALKRLRDHGFLSWLRRYVPTGNAGFRGPQVEQTSNAYRLMLPATIAAAMTAPPPDDDLARRAGRAADTAAMIASLPLDEQPAQIVEDEGLAAVLSRLGRAVMQKERDSGRQHESSQS